MTASETILPTGKSEERDTTRHVHRLLKEVQERLELFKPNTVVSAFMEWLNTAMAQHMCLTRDSAEKVIVTLSVIAPHIASELLLRVLGKEVWNCTWPTYDPALAALEEVTVAIQVNGKLRGTLVVPVVFDERELEERARKLVETWLHDKNIVRVVYVPHKLINFVVSDKNL